MKGKKWFILLLGTALLVLLSQNVGAVFGSLVDHETSTGNSFTAFTSTKWTQTTEAQFEAGVPTNVDTTTSPDNVLLTTGGGGGTGTNSPSSSTGGWSNGSNAYADGGGYASITSGTPSASETYGNYGFSLTGKTVTQVRVRYDASSAGVSTTEYEHYDTGDDGDNTFLSGTQLCQTFSSSTGFVVTSVKLLLYREANYPATVTCEIFATTGSPPYPTGIALTSSTIAGSTLPTSAGWVEFVFSSPYNLSAVTTYAIVMRGVGGTSYPVHWRCDTTSPTYGNGMAGRSSTSGAWGITYMLSGIDHMFQTYGFATLPEYEYYDTGNNGDSTFYSGIKMCQTFFSSTAFTITSVSVLLYKAGTYSGTITAGIYNTTGSPAFPTGSSALTSGTTDGGSLPTGSPYEWRSFSLTPYALSAGTTYALVLSASGGSASNNVHWRYNSSSPTYGNGMYGLTSGTWGSGSMDSTKDCMFQTYGFATTEYNDQIRVDVSWDGGTSWSSTQNTTLTNTEATTWYDVTSATAWTPAKLANGQLQIRVLSYTQNTPEQVRLDWLPVEVTYTGGGYASPGTIASQVLNTGITGAHWDALIWDKTLPTTDTHITFEVRASASSFLPGDTTITWISVGGTSPVLSGLPSGRYIQWRATLTTSNSANTPTLSEVRVYYH